jgi:ubiquinone/menaquinone biosynthesis C-methylase UbiE
VPYALTQIFALQKLPLCGERCAKLLDAHMINREHKLAQNTYSLIKKFLKSSDFILDVGLGTGLVTDIIRRDLGAQVKCIDIIDISISNIKPQLYNGKDISF